MDNKIVTPLDVTIPSPDDFISSFGCEYKVDKDYLQEYYFVDSCDNKVKLTFGVIDNSFGLSFFIGENELIRIYDEFLLSVSINESEQYIIIKLCHGGRVQEINFSVWPKNSLSITAMK